MIAAAAFLLLLSAQVPMPPYKRVETVPVFQQAYDAPVVTQGTTAFMASGSTCLAFDLTTSKREWELKVEDQRLSNLALSGTTLYATSFGDEVPGKLLAIEARTGDTLWSIPRIGDEWALAANENSVFTCLKPNSLSAIDSKTRAIKWAVDFPKPDEDTGGVDAITIHKDFVLVCANSITYCFDKNTGKKQWSDGPSYMFNARYLAHDGIALVPKNEGAVAKEIATGKNLWEKEDIGYFDGGVLFQELFVTLDGGAVRGIAPRTGDIKWSVQIDDPDISGGSQYLMAVGETLFARGTGDSEKGVIIDKAGKTVWQGKGEEALPYPIWSDAKTIVCFDGHRLLRYEHGEEDPLPTGDARAKLAQDLVSRFDELDDADKRRLVSLGDDAFAPLFKEYLAACAKYDAADDETEDTYPLYSRFQDLGDLLVQVTNAEHVADIMKAIAVPGSHPSAKPLLLTLLAKKGKPEEVTPYFLRELEQVKTPDFEMYESTSYVARNYIVRSRDPRAVAFMLKALRDPNADPVLRYEAYTHLAGTGGEEGAKAVLERRREWKPLQEFQERALVEFNAQNPTRRFALERKAPDGTTWGLLQIGVLGSETDLWLAKKQGEVWSDLVFLGVNTEGISEWVEPKVPEPKIVGKTGAELVKSEWLQLLLADDSFKKDSDADGLTDLVEKRLGTNPNEKDTDGDGVHDETDPWPNAPKRQLNDAEEVLAAAFEARYHLMSREGAAVFSAPKGMKPFEMVGWNGPVAWSDSEAWSHPLQWYYEQGIAFIRFDDLSRNESLPWEDRFIKWNADRTEATVLISTYYGGLNGSGYRVVVRKFGDQWLPVELKMEYVS